MEENINSGDLAIDIVNEKNKLHKKINFWGRYRVNQVFISFLSCFLAYFIMRRIGMPINLMTASFFMLPVYSVTYLLPECIFQKHSQKWQDIQNLENKVAFKIEKIMVEEMNFKDLQVVNQVVDTCLKEEPSVQNISDMAQVLIETGPYHISSSTAIKKVQGVPLKKHDLDTLYEQIAELNLHDALILKRWLEKYVKKGKKVDKISKMTQLMVETKLLGVPVEETEMHLEQRDFARQYKR